MYNSSPLVNVAENLKVLGRPKYDRKYLHKMVKEKLGDQHLRDTLTNVVIPTFDIKRLQPVIFSTIREFNLTEGGVAANNPVYIDQIAKI
ncbi:hypothetical protein CerSpe_047180 [Prunus speciosa]